MKEAAPQKNWEQEAEARISRSDVVVVLVGPKTHKAPVCSRKSRLPAVWESLSFKSSAIRTAARRLYRMRGDYCGGPGPT